MKNNTARFTVKSIQDLYTLIQNVTDLTPLAGTTGVLKDCRADRFYLPESVVLLKNVPDILYQALSRTANPGVRLLATIGGNIAQAPIQHSCLIPLIALDTKIEIRTRKETFWMPLIRYCDDSSNILRHTAHIILRVRVPLEEWTISHYKRLGPIGFIADDSASFVFLARTQKNLLSDVKLLFGGTHIIKSKEFENLLTGKSLPIDRRSIGALMEETSLIFSDAFTASNASEMQKHSFFNLIEESLFLLTK